MKLRARNTAACASVRRQLAEMLGCASRYRSVKKKRHFYRKSLYTKPSDAARRSVTYTFTSKNRVVRSESLPWNVVQRT